MHHQQSKVVSPVQVLRILVSHPLHWLGPAVVIALLVGVIALVRPATWEASQALVVRNEAANNHDGLGNFAHTDQMKTVQETIFELIKSRRVLHAALAEVGPPADCLGRAAWPSAEDVEDLREVVKLTPPKGAEFGKTEVFYLKVQDHDQHRAVALAGAICDQLETRFRELRDTKAQSMVDELLKAVELAEAGLAEPNARAAEIEKHVGSDLGELRILLDASTGDSTLRRTAAEIRGEIRRARAAERTSEELLAVLGAAQEDPGRLVATPNRLLESQPSLRRLREGLVDAQLRTARLLGQMSSEHPLVLAAHEAEQEIREHLHNELGAAIRAITVERRLHNDRIAMLEDQLAETTGRLDQLAALRTPYSTCVAQARHRAGLLERAERDLADARASRLSADAASLISRIDAPDTGTNPVGPGRGMIVLMGIAGGLMVGFGVLVIAVEPDRTPPTYSPPAVDKAPAAKYDCDVGLTFSQSLQKVGPANRDWN